jgi:L-fuculose-phosphate aldolase
MTGQTAVRQEMIAACRRLNAAGLNTGTSGNLSVRCGKEVLITPSGIAYEEMRPEEIVEMDFSGRYYGDYLPSSEWRFHLDILKARPDASVVLHSHAPFCSAVACCRLDIPPIHYMVATAGGDTIKCSGYALFGTPDLSREALAALGPRNACLLANHGVIVLGVDLARAYALLEEVENLARIYATVRGMGGGVALGKAEMTAVLERFKTYGKQAAELAASEGTANRIEPPERGGDRL